MAHFTLKSRRKRVEFGACLRRGASDQLGISQ
jgi:hypothetical protein